MAATKGVSCLVYINIDIKGTFDTLALWKQIEYLKVNLTTTGEMTWIYGELAFQDIGELIYYCTLYGDLEIKISRQSG